MIAFVTTATVGFFFTVAGLPIVLDIFSAWAPQFLINMVSGLSFLTHFTTIAKGVINFSDLVYFLSIILIWLMVNIAVLDLKNEAA